MNTPPKYSTVQPPVARGWGGGGRAEKICSNCIDCACGMACHPFAAGALGPGALPALVYRSVGENSLDITGYQVSYKQDSTQHIKFA